jgi:membrane protein implicated in regulation of membrane protease activity
MPGFFLICATVGGTVLVLQFLMMLFGLVDHGSPDVAGGHDVGDVHDLHDSSGGDVHAVDAEQSLLAWLWGMVSFRSVVAGLTFFGFTGLTMQALAAAAPTQWAAALMAGLAAMVSVQWIMRAIFRLAQDNTMQIKRAIGQTGTVYLPIPGASGGTGKVHLKVQGRLEEFEAVTLSPARLVAGAKVVVTGIVGADVLAVELVPAEVPAKSTAGV